MELPPGYENQKGRPRALSQDKHCCRLHKSIYGLRQSPREWYVCLTSFLEEKGFVSCPFDPCVFVCADQRVILAVYVDDMTLYSPKSATAKITAMLKSRFHLSEAGKLYWLLGIEINQHNNDRDSGRNLDIDHDIDDNYISL